MQHKLATQTVSMQDTEALDKLNHCVFEGRCAFPPNEMAQTFVAALQHTPPNTTVLTMYASCAFNALHDSKLALDLARDAVKQSPNDMQMRGNLLQLLAASGQHEAAQAFYDQTLRDIPDATNNKSFRALLDTPATIAAPIPKP